MTTTPGKALFYGLLMILPLIGWPSFSRADGLPKEETPAEFAEEAPPEENPPDTFSDESAPPPDGAEEP
ncbi:MAG TPA: hypothetical protein VI382_07515, partial [Candidatus Manganitrophaceae bacterium]|nr:hypothetical protein [Candidatus Manganitrophaceae bacterium]